MSIGLLGKFVRTDFVSGVVMEIAEGSSKGWLDEPYYLIQAGKFKPHWIRASEIQADVSHQTRASL